jgi:hypothetical protein
MLELSVLNKKQTHSEVDPESWTAGDGSDKQVIRSLLLDRFQC